MGPHDVIIERVTADAAGHAGSNERADGNGTGDRWRVRSAGDRFPALVVPGQPEALDAALARLTGTNGELYISRGPGEEPSRFNPTGA